MRDAGLLPDVVHTSVLRRAITTANLALDASDRHWIPVRRSWRLNERHYGALQGLDKAATREKYGEEQFMLWRRSLRHAAAAHRVRQRVRPGRRPALRRHRRRGAAHRVPRGRHRADDALLGARPRADLPAGQTVLVTAHGNCLRALVKHLDGICDDDIAGLNIPTGMPLVYRLDDDLVPDRPGGSTSTRTPPPRPPRPSRTRAAEPQASRRRRAADSPSHPVPTGSRS